MGDLISRQAAIDALDGEIEITGRTNAEAVKGYVRLVKDRLERLPSAQPEPHEGHWIPVHDTWWLDTSTDSYLLICTENVPIFQSVKSCDEPVSLEAIVHPQILDDAERKYLSAVISPFRDRVKHICRGWYITSSGEYQRNLSVYITLSDDVTSYNIDLPLFKKETMYKGMKIGKAYTLEELGL